MRIQLEQLIATQSQNQAIVKQLSTANESLKNQHAISISSIENTQKKQLQDQRASLDDMDARIASSLQSLKAIKTSISREKNTHRFFARSDVLPSVVVHIQPIISLLESFSESIVGTSARVFLRCSLNNDYKLMDTLFTKFHEDIDLLVFNPAL